MAQTEAQKRAEKKYRRDIKSISIRVSVPEYSELLLKKGNKTWLELLKEGL